MQKHRGFTLIELLVVVAIIALLLSVLVPALNKVRQQARRSVCLSRVRQMGVTYSAYLADNKGRMCYNVSAAAAAVAPQWKGSWVEVLRPYYNNNPQVRLCPNAVLERSSAAANDRLGPGGTLPTKYQAWGLFTNQTLKAMGQSRDETGSYGFNSWLYQVHPQTVSQYPANYFWWTDIPANVGLWQNNVKTPSDVPVFTDCWYRGSAVVASAPPPNNEDDTDAVATPAGHLGSTVCINRHNGYIGGTFADGSSRMIGLKEIWRLRWHKGMNTNGVWTSAMNPKWPQWMRKFKEY